jgi:hypothetical protein
VLPPVQQLHVASRLQTLGIADEVNTHHHQQQQQQQQEQQQSELRWPGLMDD